MIKKESLPDRPKFCRSMSAVRHLFWRLRPHPTKQWHTSSPWELCCHKQVSQAGISNYIPQFTVGCNYLSLSEIPASGDKVLIYCTWFKMNFRKFLRNCNDGGQSLASSERRVQAISCSWSSQLKFFQDSRSPWETNRKKIHHISGFMLGIFKIGSWDATTFGE